jgi:ABC-type Fe3+-siderophore transport system permease subunit
MLAPSAVSLIFTVPLMAFAVYRRVRGSFGRQPIRTRRMTARVLIFALVIGLMMLSGLQDIRLAEGALGGVAAGAALAVLLGLRLTRFEIGGDGSDFYIPNPWVGAVLTALLLGRLAWRFLALAPAMAGAAVAARGPAPGNSPLTMAIVGLTVGYYLAYYAGILVHHRRHRRAGQAL